MVDYFQGISAWKATSLGDLRIESQRPEQGHRSC